MEMPVCDETAAKKLGACLTNYYHSIGAPKPKPQAASRPAPARVTPTPSRAPPPRQTSSSSSYGSSSGGYGSSVQSRSSGAVLRGDASSATSRREAEMREMFPNRGGGGSVKDRMKMFNNNNTVNFDPIHFAVNKNKEAKGTYHSNMCCGVLVLDFVERSWGYYWRGGIM